MVDKLKNATIYTSCHRNYPIIRIPPLRLIGRQHVPFPATRNFFILDCGTVDDRRQTIFSLWGPAKYNNMGSVLRV